ncbi:TM2 domain-containing protein [bacterium]|nr:TM2 domain-containing protein [bacterium]
MKIFNNSNQKEVGIAYLLTCLSFFGISGIQRFYLGKHITGILWFLTGGLFFMGTIYDLITLPHQVKESNLLLGYQIPSYEDPSIIEGDFTIVREDIQVETVKAKSLEAQIIDLAELDDMNQLTLRDLIKAGISLDNGKLVLEKFAKEGVCEEVSMDGVKIYCF